jgi:hypothetical protein
MNGKELAEKSAPAGAAVLIAGMTSARPPATVLTPTTALKRKNAKLAREGQSWQEMWEANRVEMSYILWGVATPRRGLREAF